MIVINTFPSSLFRSVEFFSSPSGAPSLSLALPETDLLDASDRERGFERDNESIECDKRPILSTMRRCVRDVRWREAPEDQQAGRRLGLNTGGSLGGEGG